MSNNENKAQTKTRKANKYLQNLTKEDLPQYQTSNDGDRSHPSATPHVRIDTRGPPTHEEYAAAQLPPEQMNAEFFRDGNFIFPLFFCL
jgi:hypothetical protein